MRYPKFTLPDLLAATAVKSSRKTALVYFGTEISYAQLEDHVNRFAAGLQALGLKRGDRVALMMANCPQFVIAYFGVLRAGGIVTATSSMYTAREAAHQWNDAGAVMVVADRKLQPVLEAARPQLTTVRRIVLTGMREYFPRHFRQLCGALKKTSSVRVSAEAKQPMDWLDLLRLARKPRPHGLKQSDIACLQYTGGTTGTSKGAMLTHANLVINACQANAWLMAGLSVDHVTTVAALPMFHIYAMTCVMIATIELGGRIIILPRFELKAALNLIRKYRPTIYHGVPTMYVAFNNAPNVKRYGFHSLRVCMSGGAPLPVEVRQKFEALTGGKLVEGYGLTETSPVTHVNPPAGLCKTGSMGLTIADTEARMMDLENGTREMPLGEVGEIVIRGPQVMKGYWNKPEETALVLRDGWLYTGDIAKKDADGYYYIVDRKKDMIIAGGYNIYPREVEEVLFECPKVKEAGVVGVPDEYRGETVKAFVVLKAGVKATVEEIVAFCRERLAAYKVPRQVVFIDALPRSGVGKYLRRELRNL
ncbi:MAG: long-chain fatty acid--CoA ligase [Pedosphaera sp.]|nr:long-chain fatty acid--CoA ligase [Pedosphaera sp.]